VLAGKEVEFRVTVKDVRERLLPEVDDEFAAEVNDDFKTVADLREYLAGKIKAEKEDAMAGSFNDRIMQKILENHQFEVPNRLVAYEVKSLMDELEENLLNSNTSMEAAGINRAEIEERYRDLAEKRVRGDFILKKIAEVEDIKVTDEDIDNGFARVAEKYNMEMDEVKKYFARRDDLLPFINELLSEKVLDFLKKESEIVYVEPEEETPAETAEEEGA
jgi:trigger factor